MERCAGALNLAVGATLEAWSYLGRAFDEALRRLDG
jgi:hypothetical protein